VGKRERPLNTDVNVSSYNLKKILEELTKYSHRAPGSSEALKAASFIESLLRDYLKAGETRNFSWKTQYWFCSFSQLYSEKTGREIIHLPLAFSGNGNVAGKTVFVRYPEKEPIPREIENKIALVLTSYCYRNNILRRLEKNRALGTVFITKVPGNLIKESIVKENVTLPAVAISLEEGLELIRSRDSLLLGVEGGSTISEAKGISYTLQGRGDKTYLLFAHYDSMLYSPGAHENASGTTVLLEVARILNFRTLLNTYLFLFLPIKMRKNGMILEDVLKDVNYQGVIIVDRVGSLYGRRIAVIQGFKKEQVKIISILQSTGYYVLISEKKPWYSKRFSTENILYLTEAPSYFANTPLDLSSYISVSSLMEVVKTLLALINVLEGR